MSAFIRVNVGGIDRSPPYNVGCDCCILRKMYEDSRGLVDWWFGCRWVRASPRPCLKVELGLVFRDKVDWSDVEPFGSNEGVLNEVDVEGMVDGGIVVLAGLVM